MPANEPNPIAAASNDSDLDLILAAGEEAGRIAMAHFGRDPQVWYKNDGTSPVSAADIAVDTFLRETLLEARPRYGWLSEETADTADRFRRDAVFVVDPIDGTRAFIAGKPTWCVSIAVVKKGRPTAGVLVAPALGEVFAAGTSGQATKNGERLAPLTAVVLAGASPLRLSAPRDFVEGLEERLKSPIERCEHVPSLAYRLAMLADGRLDATLVKPRAHDWDIAAADAILRRVGGRLLNLSGDPVRYDRETIDHGILIAGSGSGALMPELSAALRDLQPGGHHVAPGRDPIDL